MKSKIVVSENRPCFCNSNKKFKMCHGLNVSEEVLDTYKMNFLLRDVYGKCIHYFNKHYDLKEYIKHYKEFSNVPEDDKNDHTFSFRFIEFLLFRAKQKTSDKTLFADIYNTVIFSPTEKMFLKQLYDNSHFGIFKVLEVNKDKFFIKIEHIFEKEVFEFYDKEAGTILKQGGLIYGRVFNVFERVGILPTFNFKGPENVKESDLKKSLEGFTKRLEHLQKEDSSLTFNKFINSIEYEIYGGDNPYEVYKYDDAFEKFQKEHPDKDMDDFLDLIEDELFDIKSR
ncbi:MAG: SEC-C domain-containing protein [Nanoarchaeales archaeon]|nr:SEC-C domain-containing protein [Nanoarchaeales archaeon]